MHTASIIWGIGALISIIALLLYFRGKQKRKQVSIHARLDYLGKMQHLVFSRRACWGQGYALGVDTAKQVLFYTSSLQDQETCTLLNLANVKNCTVVNAHQEVEGSRVIDQIRLSFTMKNGPTHQDLVFYDRAENLHFTNELLLAEKWKAILSAETAL